MASLDISSAVGATAGDPSASTAATSRAVASLHAQGIDPRTAAELIRAGIPITSPAAMQYFSANPHRPQVRFGNYLLLQTLGEGEFGKVKLGVHKDYGEEVAIKLIHRSRISHKSESHPSPDEHESQRLSKISREINVLRSLRHPNIVRLYEVVESDKYSGIVLEYASGMSYSTNNSVPFNPFPCCQYWPYSILTHSMGCLPVLALPLIRWRTL